MQRLPLLAAFTHLRHPEDGILITRAHNHAQEHGLAERLRRILGVLQCVRAPISAHELVVVQADHLAERNLGHELTLGP